MDHILLHIGLAKAGSKTLQAWFNVHPQLHHFHDAICGFRNTRSVMDLVVNGADKKPLYYVTSSELFGPGWFSPRSPGANWRNWSIASTITACQLQRQQARMCTILHDLFPNARILLVTRGFKTILRSGFSEYLKLGGRLDYPAFLNAFSVGIQHWLDLNHLIQLYETTFGKQKLLVLPFELMKDNTSGFFEMIEKWLGLNHFEFQHDKKNPSLTAQELYWYPRFSKVLGTCASKMTNKFGEKAYNQYLTHFLARRRMRPFVRFLNLFGERQVLDDDCPDNYLSAFKEKATVLKGNPLYAAYSAEYLWG